MIDCSIVPCDLCTAGLVIAYEKFSFSENSFYTTVEALRQKTQMYYLQRIDFRMHMALVKTETEHVYL